MPAAAKTITFAALSTVPSTECISVSATYDTMVEGVEDFDLVLTMTDQMPDVVVGASDTTAVTIPANDGMLFLWVTYRLTHGFRRYTGNIPEVLMSTARGRSPRAVLISTEGISLYTL